MKFTNLLLPLSVLASVASALPTTTTTMSVEGDVPLTVSTSTPPSSTPSVKQGLPLKAPPQRRLRGGPEPSPTPCGRLYVLASDNSYNGFVSSSLDEKGRFVVDPNPEAAVTVIYKDHRLIPLNAEVERIGATFAKPYDSPPQGPGRDNFAGNSGNFAVISGTSDTRHGHRARRGYTTYTEGYYNDIEAAIYKLDPQNSEILPTWINTDGSTHLSTFGMPSEGPHHPLVISQNIGSYNAKYGGYSARVFCVGMNLPVKLALPLDELEREQ